MTKEQAKILADSCGVSVGDVMLLWAVSLKEEREALMCAVREAQAAENLGKGQGTQVCA